MLLRFSGKSVRFSVGDSHAAFTFRHIPRVVRLGLGPVTMHRIGRDGLHDFLLFGGAPFMWPCSLLKAGDEVFFSFGEIDCRCHIARQIALGRSEGEVIETLAERYLSALKKESVPGVTFWIVSVVPPAEAARLRHFRSFEPAGSDSDRARFTYSLNKKIKQLSAEYGFEYVDVHSEYADAYGMLPLAVSDGVTHIGDTSAVERLLAG